MTLPRLRAIQKYWSRHPPISWIEAARIGLGAAANGKPTPPPAPEGKNLGGMLAAFGIPPGTKAKVSM